MADRITAQLYHGRPTFTNESIDNIGPASYNQVLRKPAPGESVIHRFDRSVTGQEY